MHKLDSTPFDLRLGCKLLMAFFAISISMYSYAELEELDDKKLKEHSAKDGLTIDLSYKLSIGEIAYDFSDSKQDDDNRTKTIAPPPPRIEYHQGNN